jgi:hypothetical protein
MTKRHTLSAAAVALFSLLPNQVIAQVTITDPADGRPVCASQEVKGTVADSKATVWVIIHPLLTPDFWV